MDYDALEAEVNRILEEQDASFVQEEIQSSVFFAQGAVESYLLSFQEEEFLGCSVDLLIEEVRALDPTDFIRITPGGYAVIPIDEDIPQKPSDLAKWVVGISCGIVVIGSTALNVFMPAARPVSGAITGAAIDVFMQVVVENHAVSDIKWSKVAVAAVSGSMLAWACPLGAAKITYGVGKATGSVLLSKLAGYGVETISNALVAGVTNAALAVIDDKEKDQIWDAFLIGAAIGACCTAAAALLTEIAKPIGGLISNAVNAKYPNNFLTKAGTGINTFIGKHQVHLSNSSIEEVLNPKSVYEAAQAAHEEYMKQAHQAAIQMHGAERRGGRYADLSTNGSERHETPSFFSTRAEKRGNGPSIKMDPDDHKMTASFGNSNEAKAYRNAQRELMDTGRKREAIQMDIDDIHSKFGDKYDDAIAEMLEYATTIGWW